MVPFEVRIREVLIKPSAVEAMGATTDNGRSVNRSSVCQLGGEVGVVLLESEKKNRSKKNPKGINSAPITASLDMRLFGEVSLEREELLISFTIRPWA
jgi:hypothetical protein